MTTMRGTSIRSVALCDEGRVMKPSDQPADISQTAHPKFARARARRSNSRRLRAYSAKPSCPFRSSCFEAAGEELRELAPLEDVSTPSFPLVLVDF